MVCRSPHGERGLKLHTVEVKTGSKPSLSSWRAWIEIVSRPSCICGYESLSSWRAWIEMLDLNYFAGDKAVALLMESVD